MYIFMKTGLYSLCATVRIVVCTKIRSLTSRCQNSRLVLLSLAEFLSVVLSRGGWWVQLCKQPLTYSTRTHMYKSLVQPPCESNSSSLQLVLVIRRPDLATSWPSWPLVWPFFWALKGHSIGGQSFSWTALKLFGSTHSGSAPTFLPCWQATVCHPALSSPQTINTSE